jgi:hypothetical protein
MSLITSKVSQYISVFPYHAVIALMKLNGKEQLRTRTFELRAKKIEPPETRNNKQRKGIGRIH